MNSLLRQSTDFERLRAARKEKRATFLNVPFQLECLKRLYDELNPPPMDVSTDHGHHRSSISHSSNKSVRSKLRLLKATLRRQHPNYRPPPGAMPVLLLFDRSGGRYFLFMQLPRDLPDGFPTLLYDNAAGDLAAYSGAIYSQVVEAIQAEETIQEMTREEGGIGAQNNNTAAVESHTTESHTAENRTDPDSVKKTEKEADKEKENEEDGAGNLRNTPAIDGDHQTEPELNIKEEEEDEESAKENVNNNSSSVLQQQQQQMAAEAVKEEEKAENQNAANSEKPESAEQAEEKLTTTPADDDDNQHHSHQLSPLQMFVKGLRSSQHSSNDQHSNDNNNSNKDSSRSSSSSKRSHHLPLVTVETTANGERIRISRKRPSISNSQAFPQFQTSSHSRGKLPKRSFAGSAAVAGGDHKITITKDENSSCAADLVCPLCEHSPFLGQADLQEHLRLLHLILGPGPADSEGEVLEPL